MKVVRNYTRAFFNDSVEKRDQCARTPTWLMEEIRDEFHVTNFDPCPAGWDGKVDGLKIPWGEPGDMVYINPPYDDIAPWLQKACEERKRGVGTVALIPARTHTRWFQEYVFRQANRIRFLEGCIKFQGYKNKCPWGSCLVVYHV